MSSEKIPSEALAQGNGKLDVQVFSATGLIVLGVAAVALISPDAFLSILTSFKAEVTGKLGWFYTLTTTVLLLTSAVLAFSRHGGLILGSPGDKPEFSNFSWLSMLISCTVGVGYAFWPVSESLWHYYQTPYLAEPGTPGAQPVAVAISMLHWGFHTWNIFALAGLAIALPAFRLGKPMNVAISLYGLLGPGIMGGAVGRLVEFLAAFATMAGVSTALGLGLIVINGGVKYIFGVSLHPLALSMVLLALIVIYMLAAMSGLSKGIRYLAEGNTWLALIWGAFILLAGPTVYMLGGMTQSFGVYLQNLLYISFWTDYNWQAPGWLGSWSVFYWLWWISWAPFCGGFFARISRGRTIREFLIGVTIVPSLISAAWFGILGSGAQYVELNSLAPLWESVQADAGQGIFRLADAFGGGMAINIVILISMFFFLATTADGASYFLAMQMCTGALQPAKSIIMICSVFMGGLAVILLLTGGLPALQSAGVAAGAVFVFILILMVISLIRLLNKLNPNRQLSETG